MRAYSSLFPVIIVVILFASIGSTAHGKSYEVKVTRKDSNLYSVTGKDIIILTRYCYEYVYYSDAILKMSGTSGKIIFIEEAETCDVKGVYGSADIDVGRYEVTVSHESDDWYEVIPLGDFIRTSGCLSLALMDDAILDLSAGGTGRIIFSDGQSCLVEGVYVRLRL